MLRSLLYEQLNNGAAQFVGVDAVTSSSIALTAAHSNRLWATYYGEIILGNVEDEGDTFKVLFDTGSSELWVPDELCESNACLTRKRLSRAERWTAKYDDRGNYIPILVKYLTGEMRAIDGTADVNLMNGIKVKDASVGLATKLDIPILMELPWDGIVGLGFTTDDQTARGARPILEAMQQNAVTYPHFRNQFAYYISKTGGNVTFGGYNNDYKRSPADEFQWAPVSNKGSYWAVNLLQLTVKENDRLNRHQFDSGDHNVAQSGTDPGDASMGDSTAVDANQPNDASGKLPLNVSDKQGATPKHRKTTIANTTMDAVNPTGNPADESGSVAGATASQANRAAESRPPLQYRNKLHDTKVIIDTGTYLIYAPQNMQNLVSSLFVDSCDAKRNLPTLVFTVEGTGFGGNSEIQLELTPDDYVLQFTDDDGETRCTLGIMVDDQQEELQLNAWTFGEVFLRAYYTVFDYDQRQIGFTPSRADLG
ncbi:aspartyl protease, putative [Babesia bigemina]|uniref:Aspartyl protease, putative n=1 Tax=Babesia bigemina TaxID=5866 RepID=A0A061D2V4_BABBI|nr:aspartyl protease, putative [Babesia bigemina]CDR94412.1 aspartyl protease, putative [Babesia bigemina]|eukprot:XP_012766598.1 aspartyl protease, putative [Babesia bigemina]